MNTHLAKLVIGCLCAALLVCAQPAPAATGNIYDFDSLTAGSIDGQDNWVNVDVNNDNLEVQPDPMGGSADPCEGMCLTMSGEKTQVFAATRTNGGTSGWSFDLSGVTKFVLGAPWVTDNGPVIDGYSGYGGEFRIVNSNTGKGIGFGASGTTTGPTYPAYRWEAFVDTAEGVSGSSRHTTGHTYQVGDPPTAWYPNSRIDFRMEVDLTANEGEGGATLYTVRRWAGETTWNAVPGLSNVDLQLAAESAYITNADQIYVWIGTRSVAQDSLIVGIPGGSLTLNKFLDKNLNGIYDGSDEMLSGWGFTVKGPCGCGVYGASPYSGTTDGTGSYTIAGGTATMAGLLDGNYPITEEDRDFWDPAATNPAAATVNAGDTSQTLSFGNRPILGDADANGIVDISDFFILKTYFDADPGLWAEGNFNADSLVDISDFFILKVNFDATHPDYVPPGGAAPTPEPATIGLLGLGGIGLLLKRRRR